MTKPTSKRKIAPRSKKSASIQPVKTRKPKTTTSASAPVHDAGPTIVQRHVKDLRYVPDGEVVNFIIPGIKNTKTGQIIVRAIHPEKGITWAELGMDKFVFTGWIKAVNTIKYAPGAEEYLIYDFADLQAKRAAEIKAEEPHPSLWERIKFVFQFGPKSSS